MVPWADRRSEYRRSLDLLPPDQEAIFYGHDGMIKLWEYWRDAFGDIQWDPEDALDLGDKFLVTAQQRGHGRARHRREPNGISALQLKRGLVVSQEEFLDRSRALEAAGLSEKMGRDGFEPSTYGL